MPNLISMLEFEPDRLPELMQRVQEGRGGLCNAQFLEATASLGGGEALVQLGVQGIYWYDQVLKTRPRYAWMIDLVGAHAQLPQIAAGLGLGALFFCRNVPDTKHASWWVDSAGSRLLTICNPETYVDFPKLFTTTEPLAADDLEAMQRIIRKKQQQSPSPRLALSLAGSNDYSTAPKRKQYPAEFLKQWRQRYPDIAIRISVPSDYVEALREQLRTDETQVEEWEGGTPYAWNAFWVNLPSIKKKNRDSEHLLLGVEMLMTAASLRADVAYPSQSFADSWINLLMNMDRNVLWGSVAGAPLYDEQAWNAEDPRPRCAMRARTL